MPAGDPRELAALVASKTLELPLEERLSALERLFRALTYRVTVVDGVETERELVSDVVTTEPVTQVTAVGTYVEPPPPLAPEPEPAQPSRRRSP